MSSTSSGNHHSVEVDGDFLPYPATKLVITQYLEASPDPPFWGLIVVAAFFDQDDNTLWSTEIFVAHLDSRPESDDEGFDSSEEESVSESSSEDSTSEFAGPAETVAERAIFSAPRVASTLNNLPRFSTAPFHPQQVSPFTPGTQNAVFQGNVGYWNPTSYSPATGHWLASFDSSLGRWVHTWQAE